MNSKKKQALKLQGVLEKLKPTRASPPKGAAEKRQNYIKIDCSQ
jgi:hypothetical protein